MTSYRMDQNIINEDIATIARAPLQWELLAGKRILITGASGMLASYVVETMLYLNEHQLSQKAEIIGLVRNAANAEHRFGKRDHLRIITQDVSEPLKIDENIDIIIHAASHASPVFYGTDPAGIIKANALGTYQLLEYARTHGTQRFLYFSSGEIYGEFPVGIKNIREDQQGIVNPTSLRSCYAESKRIAETMCVAWHHQFKVHTIIVRPFHTYGPPMRLDDGRVFADFVRDIVQGTDITLTSDGSAERAFCYITDATIGFFTALLKGEPGTAYNVGNDEAVISIKELAITLSTIIPDKQVAIRSTTTQTQGYIPSAFTRNAPDVSKMRALGWRPIVGIKEGFTRTVRSHL